MKFSDGQSKFSPIFNFMVLCYSRKLDAREKLVFYSSHIMKFLVLILGQL